MLENKLKLLPPTPGCYLMKNSDDTIIYVGKAKNLQSRVKSYFRGAHNEKTTLLISEIIDFSYIVTNSEQESLILELNLIKKHLPKYNIRLIDDKTYPYIEITTEKNPRILVVREKKKGRRIFGPYPNSYSARETVRLLNQLYPLRKCNALPKIECLYYHMDQCLAPCINKEKIDYSSQIDEITKFLKGDTKVILEQLKSKMSIASESLEYEKAVEYRDLISHINNTTEKQLITSNDFKDRDFISFRSNQDDLALQVLKMREGRITDNHHVVFSYVGEPLESAISYVQQMYLDKYIPSELLFDTIFPSAVMRDLFGNKAVFPMKGDKKKLVDLTSKNAQMDLDDYYMLYRHKSERKDKALLELQEMLGVSTDYIEVFDNANLFGTAPISALIVYKNNTFERTMYRRYHIKTTTNDDYQMLREVIYRRYQRLLTEKALIPPLIFIDGGKGHVLAALEVIWALNLNIMVVGLKKDNRHVLESLVFQDKEIKLDKNNDGYRLLLSFSEEVHRFAITFHRKTRQSGMYASKLDTIRGIGKKRKQQLLEKYDSIEEIKLASVEELIEMGLSQDVVKNLKEGLE